MNLKVAVVGIICFGPSSSSTSSFNVGWRAKKKKKFGGSKTEIYSINLERGTATGGCRWGNPPPPLLGCCVFALVIIIS